MASSHRVRRELSLVIVDVSSNDSYVLAGSILNGDSGSQAGWVGLCLVNTVAIGTVCLCVCDYFIAWSSCAVVFVPTVLYVCLCRVFLFLEET